MVTVNIVDDHRVLVEGLARLINESEGVRVGAVAHTVAECRNQLRESLPDVLLLDINLTDGDGVELCRELRIAYPKLWIIAITSCGEYTVAREMLAAGANGYLLKNTSIDELLDAILSVVAGEAYICREVETQLNKGLDEVFWLTPREKELLGLIVQGYTNAEIAERIFLSPETIKSYRKNLVLKLGARNTASLVKLAIERKLV